MTQVGPGPAAPPAPVPAETGPLAAGAPTSLVARLRERLTRLPWGDLLGSWTTARLVVLLALALSTLIRRQLLARFGFHLPTEGLLGWDADWYRRIAEHGYGGAGRQSLRFFPLFPLLVRLLAWPLGGSVALAMLLMANGGALVYAALLYRLARREGLGEAVARRAVWVLALAPAGFVLVMGYTEALYGVLVVGVLGAARDRRWLLAAALGVLAGAARPTGLLLALPVLVEAGRGWRAVRLPEAARRLLAVAGPAVGMAGYLGWVALRYGDPLLPLRLQGQDNLRGGAFYDPFPELWQVAHDAVVRDGPITILAHLPVLLVCLGLTVVVARRLPLSYTAFTLSTLALALTARRLSSFERYAGSAVPLLLAAALVLVGHTRGRVLLALGAVGLSGYSVLAFTRLLVP